MKPAAVTPTASLAVAALTVAALTGCSSPRSGASTPDHDAPTTSTAPSLSARAAAEHDALAAYRGMWKAFVHAGRTSDAGDPLLRRYTRDTALTTITSSLTKSKSEGQISKGHVVTHVVVTGTTPADRPTEVDVQDCLDSRAWLNYHTDGTLVDHVPGGSHKVTAVVTKQSGSWKVSQFAAEGVGTCT